MEHIQPQAESALSEDVENSSIDKFPRSGCRERNLLEKQILHCLLFMTKRELHSLLRFFFFSRRVVNTPRNR